MTVTHPDDATLQRWYDRALPVSDQTLLDEHLAVCADCSARVRGLRVLHGAMQCWAEEAPVDLDLTTAILSRVNDDVRANDTGVPPSTPVRGLLLDGLRVRRPPGRAVLYPAMAAAAALVLFLVGRKPIGVHFDKVPAATPSQPVVETGGGAGGVEVTQVDVQGAQSYSVLQVQGIAPGAMTAIVWIQDSDSLEESSSSNAH